jgi:formylglycine-generating enzyme required for sulfatase activity
MPEKNNIVSPIDFQSPEAASVKKQWKVSPVKAIVVLLLVIVLPVLFFILNARAVIVTTNAKNGQIRVSDSLHLPIGNALLLMHGEHLVTIQADGYYDLSEKLMVNSETPQQVTYAMTPLPGHLNINVEIDDTLPISATLKETDSDKSYSLESLNPVLLENIPAGSYQLILDANLYAEKRLDVVIEGKEIIQQLSTTLDPNWGYVRAKTNPSGAELYANDIRIPSELNDDSSSTGNYQTRLESGLYKVEIKLKDYKPVVREFTLMPEQVFDFGDTSLELIDSTLNIDTAPHGVTVLINDNYAGETPITLDVLPNKEHAIHLFKTGYLSQTDTVAVAKNTQQNLTYTLQPDLIPISVSVYPENATLRINDEKVSVNDNQIKLPAIQHAVSVSAKGYATQNFTFVPVRGTRQLLQVRLLTEEQAIWANVPAQYRSATQDEMKLFRDSGKVVMGSNRRETGRRANETVWQAHLERPFYVSLKEVTNQQYKAFNAEHSSGNFNGASLDGANQPVVNISWQDAALYCNWLSELEGLPPFYTTSRGFVSGVNLNSTGYRLPTEAEWTWLSKFTVSGFEKKYIWGDKDVVPGPVENFADTSVSKFINFTQEEINDGFITSSPVGSFAANEKGLYDLAGNVTEWLHDWYSPSPYPSNEKVTDPLGPEEGEFHVIRGASWARGYLPQLRLAYRDYDSTGRNDLGFRVARYALEP